MKSRTYTVAQFGRDSECIFFVTLIANLGHTKIFWNFILSPPSIESIFCLHVRKTCSIFFSKFEKHVSFFLVQMFGIRLWFYLLLFACICTCSNTVVYKFEKWIRIYFFRSKILSSSKLWLKFDYIHLRLNDSISTFEQLTRIHFFSPFHTGIHPLA